MTTLTIFCYDFDKNSKILSYTPNVYLNSKKITRTQKLIYLLLDDYFPLLNSIEEISSANITFFYYFNPIYKFMYVACNRKEFLTFMFTYADFDSRYLYMIQPNKVKAPLSKTTSLICNNISLFVCPKEPFQVSNFSNVFQLMKSNQTKYVSNNSNVLSPQFALMILKLREIYYF